LTLDIYPEMRKVTAHRNTINDNPYYPDRQISVDISKIGPVYLYFPNGTYYNITAISATTYLTVPDYFAWVQPGSGEMYVYKVQNHSDITNRCIRIESMGSVKTMSTLLTYAEVYPFKFWGAYSDGIRTKQLSILQAINDGTHSWDETFALTPEGSTRWQLKHYSDISIYTDKNMTGSTFSIDLLTLNIRASIGHNSTTLVYAGDFGVPRNVAGATSYHYDSTTKILIIIKSHLEIEALIFVRWDTSPSEADVGGGHSNERNHSAL